MSVRFKMGKGAGGAIAIKNAVTGITECEEEDFDDGLKMTAGDDWRASRATERELARYKKKLQRLSEEIITDERGSPTLGPAQLGGLEPSGTSHNGVKNRLKKLSLWKVFRFGKKGTERNLLKSDKKDFEDLEFRVE